MRPAISFIVISAALLIWPEAAAGEPLLERAIGLLDRLEATSISVDYRDERLAEVLDDIASRLPVSLRADWSALEAVGVSGTDEVTLRLDATPASSVLAAVMLAVSDDLDRPTVEAHAGQIVMTSLAATSAMQHTDVYDVRDILDDDSVMASVRRPADVPEGTAAPPDAPIREPDDERPAEQDDDAPAPGVPALPMPDMATLLENAGPLRPRSAGEHLVLLLSEHVDPESWLDMGGSRASIDDRGGMLFVTAPPTLHRRLRGVLAKLRAVNPGGITLEAAIVDIPRRTLDAPLRRYRPSSDAIGRAVMLDRDAVALWRTTAAATIDEMLMTSSVNEGVAVTLRLIPRLDRAHGVLSLQIEAESREHDDVRSVSTTVTIPDRRGSALIELPAATAGDTARCLVVLPRRG